MLGFTNETLDVTFQMRSKPLQVFFVVNKVHCSDYVQSHAHFVNSKQKIVCDKRLPTLTFAQWFSSLIFGIFYNQFSLLNMVY